MLSRAWWEHLTPRQMHSRLSEVQTLLQRWCSTDYGRFWLDIATREGGVTRVLPGDYIPAAHIIALPNRPMFIAPQRRIRSGHRTVAPTDFVSGHVLADEELALAPEIRLDVVEDEALVAAAIRRDRSAHIPGVLKPSQVFSAPARLLITPASLPSKAYVLYQHIFGSGPSYPDDGFFYVGVTKRSWQARWAEHRRAMRSGSRLLFHRKLREELNAERVTYIHHKVMAVTDDIEQLYASEEWLVEGHWKDQRRLNMIPGGKSGLKYLREHGMLNRRAVPEPDGRDRLVENWLREHPRKGMPAPWVAEKWKDADWAMAQICSQDSRLSIEQVRAIRELAKAYPASLIAERIGARHADQVQRVIDGSTYARVV